MQSRKSKGLKPLLVKYAAMLMGICYLINPLQQQVYDVIHVISHTFASPNHILSHDVGHAQNLNVHKSPNHLSDELDHEHKLIDIVQTIFEASGEEDYPQDDFLVKVKCDKHLVSNRIILSSQTMVLLVNHFPHLLEELKKGYLNKWQEPPQKILLLNTSIKLS